jgi:hypothetical protein
MNEKKKIIFILFIFALLSLPKPLRAATLSLEPSAGQFGPNSVFELKVELSLAGGECINAAQIEVDFPQYLLEIRDFNTGDSIFSLWIEKPETNSFQTINKIGKISFTGGLPGGYCGKISDEQTGSSSEQISKETVASLIFAVKKSVIQEDANIGFSSLSQALLNNGEGDPVELKFNNAHLIIKKDITDATDVWQEKLSQDKTPPENFTINIGRNESMFDGQYFLAFAAVDKQTGIDHYEVLEVLPKDLSENKGAAGIWEKISGQTTAELNWVTATSPYLLKDQTLKSTIKVKAVDKAGNKRIVEYENNILHAAIQKNAAYLKEIIIGLVAFMVLLAAGIVIFLYWRKRIKNNASCQKEKLL